MRNLEPPPPAAAAAEPPTTPEIGRVSLPQDRRAQLDAWFDRSRDSGPFGWFSRDVNGGDVSEALQGRSELGALNADEQRYLVDRSLQKWAPADQSFSSPGQVIELAEIARRNGGGATGEVIGERFVRQADALLSRPQPNPGAFGGSQQTGGTLAYLGFTATGDGNAQARLVNGLSPEAAGRIGGALAERFNHFVGGRNPSDNALHTTLDALARGPMGEPALNFVEHAFAGTDASAYRATPELAGSMGRALAGVWYPNDAALRSSEANRFAGILATDQGRSLVADQRVPAPARLQALVTLRDNPQLTGDVLARHDGSGWDHPDVMRAMAQPMADQFLSLRGNAPLELRGTHLDNTVGMAMGFPVHGVPANETREQTAAREAAVARGEHSYYAQGPNAEAVRKVVEQIRAVGGDAPRVTVLPIQYSNAQTGAVTLPLFRVEGADGQTRFVDNLGRSYQNFDDWRSNNNLPEGTMVYPAGGQLARDQNGQVRLESGATPKTPDTFGEHFVNALDTIALVGGIIAGGAILIGSGGTAAPFVLAGAAAWQAGRTGVEMYDRSAHGQSNNPFTDREALSLWVNMGASALGAGAAGSAFRLARMADAGRAISPLAATTTAALNVGANAADAAATLNTGHLLLTNWEQLTPAQRAQMGLSMAFWGVSSAASTRMAGARTPSDFVNMTFNPVAMRQQLLDTYRPPVVRDSQMPGNAVRIDYTEANGLVTGVRIRAGESAQQADIDLHARVAQSMMQHSGLEGRLRNLMSRNGEAPVGSRAWEAQFEIEKLGRVINANRAQLDNPALSPAERSQVEADIRAYEQELARHRATVEGFEGNWARGTGFIDADSAGRIRAQELGLPERPVSSAAARQLGLTEEQAAGYHWYLPPGHDTPTIRSRLENQPHLAWDDSAQAVARVAGDPVRPTYVNDQPTILNLSAADRQAYESALHARDQAMAARDRLLDLKERQQVVLTARQDAELRRLQGTVSEQSRIVGEIGARQYVEQTYPNARLEYGGPNAGSQAGDFDQIWRVPGTNGTGDRFILVEAKGGSATLGTRRIGTQVETQGTTAYYNEIMSIMSRSPDPNVRKLMDEVRAAQDRGGVSYLEVKTPIHGGAVDDVRVREFRIAA